MRCKRQALRQIVSESSTTISAKATRNGYPFTPSPPRRKPMKTMSDMAVTCWNIEAYWRIANACSSHPRRFPAAPRPSAVAANFGFVPHKRRVPSKPFFEPVFGWRNARAALPSIHDLCQNCSPFRYHLRSFTRATGNFRAKITGSNG
jgi:hypothetical protein